MKVILLQDVAKIGKRYQVATVPDGYALNQLIPKKMAQPATPENLKRVQKMAATTTASRAAHKERFDAAVVALKATPLQLTADANEQSHLFKAVSVTEIVKAAAAAGVTIDESEVHLAAPLKSLGEQEIELVQGDARATITIVINKK